MLKPKVKIFLTFKLNVRMFLILRLMFIIFLDLNVATPLWPSVRMKLTLPKLRTWSPLGLPNV